MPPLKSWKQKQQVRSKSKGLCPPQHLLPPKKWAKHLSHPSGLTPGTPLPLPHMRNQLTSKLGEQAREPVTCFHSALLQFCVAVARSCLIFATAWTVSGSLQDPFIHGILGWGAIPFSRGSSRPRDQSQVSCITGSYFTFWTTYYATVGAPIKSCLNFLPGFINFY